MRSAIAATLLVVPMILGVWCAIFGGIGAILARQAGRRGLFGALLGTGLGPLGWFLAARSSSSANEVRLALARLRNSV